MYLILMRHGEAVPQTEDVPAAPHFCQPFHAYPPDGEDLVGRMFCRRAPPDGRTFTGGFQAD